MKAKKVTPELLAEISQHIAGNDDDTQERRYLLALYGEVERLRETQAQAAEPVENWPEWMIGPLMEV